MMMLREVVAGVAGYCAHHPETDLKMTITRLRQKSFVQVEPLYAFMVDVDAEPGSPNAWWMDQGEGDGK